MRTPRLLPDIVALTPSRYEDYMRCPRLYYCNALLGMPASDLVRSADQGLVVHDILKHIHSLGSCADDAHVTDVLAAHALDTPAVRDQIARHAQRCPARASSGAAHEWELARFHRMPKPMFMVNARIDAIWVHDGLLDARDYKTGGRYADRVADIPAARVQAFALAGAARERGLQVRLRYEYLQPEVDDDPDPWEPDDDDLAAVEEELRDAVERMWSETDWRGIGEVDVCSHCRYRSICRDSAAPSEPAWPALADQ
ncbi:MAG TPA: PD-(D/E)XK nuclease family protein [Acidimicrobiia bacterium]|nr:PD-(D/E)XK nuclease family protein [Acidimicrobiia bacterium]